MATIKKPSLNVGSIVDKAKDVANNLTASAQRQSPTTRTYNDDGSYTDKDSSGRTVGWGAKGTENLATNGGIMQGSGGSGSGGGGSSNGYNAQNYINQWQQQINNMYDQQRQSQLDQLRHNQNKAVGQINQQKTETGQQYQGMRNQTDAVNLQNVQRLREAMAANGLTASGENVTAQTNLAAQRQNSLNTLNTQEQQTINDYNRRITDLMDPANENALIAQLEAERAKSLLNLGMQADQIGYSRSRDSVMDQRYLDELAYGRGRDTEMDRRYYDELYDSRDWRDTQWNYQLGRDQISDNRYDQQWEYQVGRDKVSDDRYNQEWEYNKEQAAAERAWREYTYNNMSASEKAQMEWARQQFGEDMAWRMYSMQYQGELDRSMAQSQLDAYTGDGSLDFLP